jgi:hydroxyacylglutathione hydrolase
MAIIPVPQLKDNFAYLVVDETVKQCGVVDCAEADKVLAAVKREGVQLIAALSTHWHPDHVGGNLDLIKAVPGIKIFGARAENGRIPGLTDGADDGEVIRIASLEAQVLGIPAHTNGHIAYYFPKLKAVFSGDTLFIAGCGRVFEGKAGTMLASLRKLAALPDDTRVYCGHEYTQRNLEFALTLEPNNRDLKAKYEWTLKTRAAGQWTIPSTIGDEKRFNPFLRVDSPELLANLKQRDPALGNDPVAIFARARELKDQF